MEKTIRQQKNNPIFKDYILKIKNKSFFEDKDIVSEDINNLIILLNWCFHKKNNFFIEDFNKKNVYPICISYNQLKTNILSKEYFDKISDIFYKIDAINLKTLKFVLYHYINNFDVISTNDDNYELCETVTKNSIKNCINYLTKYLEETK
jgi:hypothetical protein